ncbi:MAG TPA: redoxin domain-containing protein [Candidatus Eisenbacteria bacterium]|nr:redoxin domain-containing protein [Candidatus Eisenbacteria bacterium]
MNITRTLFLSAVAAAVLLGAFIFALPAMRSERPRSQVRPSPPSMPDAVASGAGVAEPPAPAPSAPSTLPVLADTMPEFTGITEWLNGGPETPASLRGRVVLVQFWTLGCANCIATMPHVVAWHDRYVAQGFTVIGVHTPEFAYEGEKKNVLEAIRRHGVRYPVPMDNAFQTWNLYGNMYWPSFYLYDSQGRLRYRSVGEGGYDEMERNIRALLSEKQR